MLKPNRCWLIALLVAKAFATPASQAQDSVVGWPTPLEHWVSLPDSPIMLVSQVDRPSQPQEIRQPLELDPSLTDLGATGEDTRVARLSSADLRDLYQPASSPTADTVGRAQVATSAPTDLGSLLQKSDDVQTVNSQQRSPIAFDPHVRSFRFGEIYTQAAGEYYLPARLDLDSMLSKIDPYLIQAVTVIPGPYGLRYGPGFAYIDVVTMDTPRSCCGTDVNNRFGILARGNGSQIIGQDTVTIGGETWGSIANYGMRTGADYRAGNGQLIPSSFHSQNVLLQLGFDVGDGRIEARYNRFDMWDTEYALQFFDISSMKTDSYNVIYSGVDPMTDAQNTAQVWYNTTGFDGNNLNQSKTEIRARIANGLNNDFNTNQFNPGSIQGFTQGNLVSTGARAVRTYGEETGEFARVGADVRYVTQSTSEEFFINDTGGFLRPDEEHFFTNQPHSALTDPGIFLEYGTPWTPYFKTVFGSRVDWVNTHPRTADYDDSPLIPGIIDRDFTQNDVLLAGYVSGELELTPEWSIRSGLGYAERVPDLVNRYADGVFLGILQNGFSKVVGFPALRKSQLTQADISLVADYEYGTGRATYFYSWINDYNTYVTFGVDPPSGAQILLAQNTPFATLTGFELYGDYRTDEITTLFAAMQYVEGTDHAIDRPLPQIYPLQGRLGIRWTDPSPENVMGLEWGFRLVARQSRVGYLREGLSTNAVTSVAVETPTAGFMTSYLRGYYNLTDSLHLVGGVDNLFDRNYLEHLDLRLQGPAVTPGGVTAALSPGFTAYAGIEWLL